MCDAKTANKDLAELVTDRRPLGIVYDIPRSSVDKEGNLLVSYHSIESVKNKFIFSGKYHGVSQFILPADKIFKVLIFANSPPDYSMMSSDRWQCYEICKYPQHPNGIWKFVIFSILLMSVFVVNVKIVCYVKI